MFQGFELASPVIELPPSPKEPVYVQEMANRKTRFTKSRNKLRSLLRANLEEQSKSSGLVSLMEEIKDQISDIAKIKESYNNVEDFQWLQGQLVCLQRRINKEIAGRLTYKKAVKIPVSLSVRKVE